MINKKVAINLMSIYGDFIVDYVRGCSDAKVCTTDFKNKHIRSITRKEKFNLKGNILLFNWTDNEFQAIPVKVIHKITPLSNLLNNKGKDEHAKQQIKKKCYSNSKF